MKYQYKCQGEQCQATTELIQPISAPLRDSIDCPYCGAPAKHVFEGAPAVATQNMGHQTFDVAIGRDAATRWQAIEDRQQKRDKIRRESGQNGLVATGANEYTAISTSQKTQRTSAANAVERDGFRPTYDSGSESSVMAGK